MSKKTKRSICFGWGFYVCIMGGIFGFSILFDLGDGILAAGLECGAGFALGFCLFYIGTYLHLPGCYVDEKSKDEQNICGTCGFGREEEGIKAGYGTMNESRKFVNSKPLTVFCEKHNTVKEANEASCDDWKAKQ